MHREGHIGLTLTFFSVLLYLMDSWSNRDLLLVLIAVGFSTIPDVDLKFGKHRRFTHTLTFAFLSGLFAGFITYELSWGFDLGFNGAFSGVVSHIIGDLMTYRAFAPLYPLSNRRFALRLFKSSNKFVNIGFLIAGIVLFTLAYKKGMIFNLMMNLIR